MFKITAAGYHYTHYDKMGIHRKSGLGENLILLFHSDMRVFVNGKTYCTAPGTVLIYKIGSEQHYCGTQEHWCNDWVHFISDQSDEYLKSLDLSYDKIYKISEAPKLSVFFQQLENQFLKQDFYCIPSCDLYLRQILFETSKQIRAFSDPQREEMRSILQHVRDSITLDYSRNWTIDQMAALSSMSPSYFHKKYKLAFNISPIRDLMLYRLEAAKNQLLHTGATVEKIAENIGYENSFYFIRQFKVQNGISPGAYRKKYQ